MVCTVLYCAVPHACVACGRRCSDLAAQDLRGSANVSKSRDHGVQYVPAHLSTVVEVRLGHNLVDLDVLLFPAHLMIGILGYCLRIFVCVSIATVTGSVDASGVYKPSCKANLVNSASDFSSCSTCLRYQSSSLPLSSSWSSSSPSPSLSSSSASL